MAVVVQLIVGAENAAEVAPFAAEWRAAGAAVMIKQARDWAGQVALGPGHRPSSPGAACRLPWTCPHGRPIAHTIRTEELNHFFHRPSLPVNAF